MKRCSIILIKKKATKHYTTLGYHFSHISLVKNIQKFDMYSVGEFGENRHLYIAGDSAK